MSTFYSSTLFNLSALTDFGFFIYFLLAIYLAMSVLAL